MRRPPKTRNVTIAVGDVAAVRKAYDPRSAITDGVLLARDLVNEPANVLYPEEFARRTLALKKLRVAVEVLDVRAMKKLGMNALAWRWPGLLAPEPRCGDALERWAGRRGAGCIYRQRRVFRHRRYSRSNLPPAWRT